jgi:hypothetical protein
MSPFWPGENDKFDMEDIILHDNDWYLLKTEKLGGYQHQQSVIGHHCQKFKDPQWLDEADCMDGRCWWCGEEVPESVLTVWSFQNWEQLPKFRKYINHHNRVRPKPWDASVIYEIPRHRYEKLRQEIGDDLVKKWYQKKERSMTWGPAENLFG